jgi:ketosteroid isomerase-like protein
MREAADTRAADEQTIRAAEIKAVEALDAGDVDAYMAAYPEGSVWLPPNSPSVSGPEAIRALASQLAAGPDFAFHVEPTTVEVSRSGDLAYLVGSFQMTVNDATGNPVTDRGKFVEVWRKHPDQTWKHVLAIWNSDEPPQK